MCCARRTRTPRSSRSTSSKAKAAPGVLAVLTGEDWDKSGFGDLPVPCGPEAPRRLAALQAALSGAGARPRALGRRLRRLRGGRDRAPGDGRRRADRGRLRAAAGDRLGRGRDQAGRAAGLGRLPEQHLLRASRRRQGQDRRGLREGRTSRQASLRDQPRDRGQHGAARLDRRLSPARRSLHHLHHAAAQLHLPRGAVQVRAQGAGAQGARRVRRHRRLVRHEERGLQRGARWCCGRPRSPAGR